MKIFCCFVLLSCTVSLRAQKFDSLGRTPPMGWNSWNTFQTKISEQLVMDVADEMVSSGMRDAGYLYLVLDDGWMTMERDSAGNLVADPQKFPHGMKALADYVHQKGLKFGLYNCAGTKTCAGYPGTRGYEYQDGRYYAALTIDYLKYDWCNTEGINAKEAYGTMSRALRQAGRPLVFSLCEWGQNKPWEWAAPYGQLWRTTGDINNCFEGTINHGSWSANCAMKIVDLQDSLRRFAGPGHWNDPDMLEVGNGMTSGEDRAHFSMWCMLAAPLIAGNDIRHMSAATKHILTNREVIAVDQDPLGIEGFKYRSVDSLEIWFKPLVGGAWAFCLLNRSSQAKKLVFDWKKEQVLDALTDRQLNAQAATYQLRDLWLSKQTGTTADPLRAEVPAHDIVMLKLTR
jgi:alpha-galactosidase